MVKKMIWIAIFLTGTMSSLQAQSAPGETLTSYRRAHEILEASMHALGGREALVKTEHVYIREIGTAPMLFQSRHVDPPFDPWSYETAIAFDIPGAKAYEEYKFRNPKSEYIWWVRSAVRGESGYEAIVQMDVVIGLPEASIENYRNLFRRLPQNIVAEALARGATLRWLGSYTFEARKHEAISFNPASGRSLTLYIDSKTFLPSKYEYIYTRNTVGDATREIMFMDYQLRDGIMIPTRRVARDAGYVMIDVLWTEVKLGHHPPDSLFEIPKDRSNLTIIKPVRRITTIADGVHLLENIAGGYNVMIVEFEDFAIVAEAPEDNAVSNLSAGVIASVKEIVPDKPIRFLVATHHHSDHASGARAYMAEGASIIVAPEHKRFFEQLGSAPYTITQDALAHNPRQPILEIVSEKKRVIMDRNQTVEIHEIGPLTHSNEMLIAYLPKQKILFQSDLFNPVMPGNKEGVTSDMIWHGIDRNDTIELLKRIKTLGLDVETIIGTHGRRSSKAELTEWIEGSGRAR